MNDLYEKIAYLICDNRGKIRLASKTHVPNEKKMIMVRWIQQQRRLPFLYAFIKINVVILFVQRLALSIESASRIFLLMHSLCLSNKNINKSHSISSIVSILDALCVDDELTPINHIDSFLSSFEFRTSSMYRIPNKQKTFHLIDFVFLSVSIFIFPFSSSIIYVCFESRREL